jgi:asparagine synthase (glutamine-hydrolysing)
LCGIAGIIAQNGLSGENHEQLRLMTKALEHRGPDAEGYYHDRNICFGHRRLSIIDLSTISNQPMKNRRGDVVVIFNGEIYNHIELRLELENEFQFVTDHSDTETIVHAYSKWGIEALKRLNGMFGLAIYDTAKGIVYLARDRIGEKPLYYTQNGNCFYFASEIKAFFAARVIEKVVNDRSVYNYLTFLTTNAPDTFFKGINKLEAGHYLKIANGSVEKVSYWNVADHINTLAPDPFETACVLTEKMLYESIKKRNLADVPISVAASGGLDSSLNLIFSREYNREIAGINVSYSIENINNERSICERFCSDLGLPLTCEIIDQARIGNLISEYLAKQIDMPFGSPDSCLFYLIAGVTKRNLSKVLLVGEGGDEVGGYPVYDDLFREFRLLRHLPVGFLVQNRWLPGPVLKRYDIFFKGSLISRRHIHAFGEYEKKKFWRGARGYNSYEMLNEYMKEIRDDLEDSYLRKVLNIEYKLRLPELLLARLDYACMALGVEARAPFLDTNLVEYSCRLPYSVKMKEGAKSVLREISAKHLPRYIVEHPKIGFGAFLEPFLKDEMPIWFSDSLLKKDAWVHEYVEKAYLKRVLEDHQRRRNRGYEMWILFVLERWLANVAAECS